jgi:hypothetical protein
MSKDFSELSARTKIDLWSAVYPFMIHRFYCLEPSTNYPSNLEFTQALVEVWHNILTPYSSWRANLSPRSRRSLKFLKAANVGNTKLKYCQWVPLGLKTKYVFLVSRNTNKMQFCNRIYYSKVYWRLNMFRAAHRSSPGALNCKCSLCFIYPCGDRPLPRLNLGNGRSPHGYINQKLQIKFRAPDDERCAARNMLSL